MIDAEKAAQVSRLKRSNAQIKNRIHQLGFTETNIEATHVQALVNFLVEAGIITLDQALDFTLRWEQELNNSLCTMEMRAQEAVNRSKLMRR